MVLVRPGGEPRRPTGAAAAAGLDGPGRAPTNSQPRQSPFRVIARRSCLEAFDRNARAQFHRRGHPSLNAEALNRNELCVPPLQLPPTRRGAAAPACDTERYHPKGARCYGAVTWHCGWATHQVYGAVVAIPWLRAAAAAADALAARLKAVAGGGGAATLGAAVAGWGAAAALGPPPPASALPKPLWCTQPPPKPGAKPRTPEEQMKYPALLCAAADAGLACATEYAPRAGAGVEDLLLSDDARALAAADPANRAAKGGEHGTGCGQGFVDVKAALGVTAADARWTALRLPAARAGGALVICEPSTGWNRPAAMGSLASRSDAEWEWRTESGGGGDGEWAPFALRPLSGNNHLTVCHEATAPLPGTGAVLIRVRPATVAKGRFLRISHVMWSESREGPVGG